MLNRPDNILDLFFPSILFNIDVNPSRQLSWLVFSPRSSLILMLTRPDNYLALYFPSILFNPDVNPSRQLSCFILSLDRLYNDGVMSNEIVWSLV